MTLLNFIHQKLLNRSISIAWSITIISDSVINIIHHSRKSLLFDKTSAWVKKVNNFVFDLRWNLKMEPKFVSFLEFTCWFLLESSDVLYRDDGLPAINSANDPRLDRIRKDIALFKKEGLSIIKVTNHIETDFLDVTFNLATKKYFPFWKANNTPLYINAFSNCPPRIIKRLPKMTNKRISDLSCNKEEFNKVTSVYETVLKGSGHCSSMSYNNSNTQNARRNRNRKVTWFNPPYSQNVKANIGKLFIKLVRKHFLKNNKYHKIFNLNTLKCFNLILKCWAKQMTTTTANVIAYQNQTAHWMVTVSLNF